jgi:hypothetical protein
VAFRLATRYRGGHRHVSAASQRKPHLGSLLLVRVREEPFDKAHEIAKAAAVSSTSPRTPP